MQQILMVYTPIKDKDEMHDLRSTWKKSLKIQMDDGTWSYQREARSQGIRGYLLDPLRAGGFIVVTTLLGISRPADAINPLFPILASNSTSNFTNSSTSNTTAPLNSTSSNTTSPSSSLIDSLNGFSKPNPLVNFYFIFLIFVFLIGYFAFRYFRKRRRQKQARMVTARRTQALRQDIENAAVMRNSRRGGEFLSHNDSDGTDEGSNYRFGDMIQTYRFRDLFSTHNHLTPPPPYTSSDEQPHEPPSAYLGVSRLPVYSEVIQEETEEQLEQTNNESSQRWYGNDFQTRTSYDSSEGDSTSDGGSLVRSHGVSQY
ncbi:hypothetical protein V1511DRAFT_103078 [Dipodascopsis uninucleata]